MPIFRWSKAAANIISKSDKLKTSIELNKLNAIVHNQHARLTCVIAAEPAPEVSWIREPANLTLVEGGQFYSIVKQMRFGLYHAILYIIEPQNVDMGQYFCKVNKIFII